MVTTFCIASATANGANIPVILSGCEESNHRYTIGCACRLIDASLRSG